MIPNTDKRRERLKGDGRCTFLHNYSSRLKEIPGGPFETGLVTDDNKLGTSPEQERIMMEDYDLSWIWLGWDTVGTTLLGVVQIKVHFDLAWPHVYIAHSI